MKIKKILTISVISMLSLVPVAFAQTGLFSGEGSSTFLQTGIIFIILIIIFKTVAKDFFKRKK